MAATDFPPEARPGVQTLPLAFQAGKSSETQFARADLVFEGVDHSRASYEVRVFLNNPEATDATPKDPDRGYAGRFVVFGHGGCFGDAGHCETGHAPVSTLPGLKPNPLDPQTKDHHDHEAAAAHT